MPAARGRSARARAARRARGQARRPRRARHAAARGGPVPVRPRHRRRRPRRSRPASPGRSRRCAAPAARAPAATRARRRSTAQLANGAATKRVGLVGLERVPVREGATDRRRARPQARPRDQRHARRRPSTSRSRWPTCRPRTPLPGTRGLRRRARQAPADARRAHAVHAAPLLPRLTVPPIHLQPRSTPMTTKYTADHEWINIDDARGRHRRHHACTRRTRSATWSSSTCPRSARPSRRARSPAWSSR